MKETSQKDVVAETSFDSFHLPNKPGTKVRNETEPHVPWSGELGFTDHFSKIGTTNHYHKLGPKPISSACGFGRSKSAI